MAMVRMASIDLCEGCRQYYAECVCGTAYAPHKCAAEGCAAILYYPDEGMACEAHTCAGCGGVLPPNPALALVEGYACDKCYGGRWDK